MNDIVTQQVSLYPRDDQQRASILTNRSTPWVSCVTPEQQETNKCSIMYLLMVITVAICGHHHQNSPQCLFLDCK